MKRIISVILTLALCLGLAACGGNEPAPSTVAPATNASTVAPASSGASVESPSESTPAGAAAIRPANYPKDGTLEIVCGFAAGGGTDNNCRALAKYIETHTDISTVVTNIAGSQGRIGFQEVLNNPADGEQITIISLNTAPVEYYDLFEKEFLDDICKNNLYVEENFTVLSLQHDEARALAIRSDDKRFSNAEELFAYAKEHPGELNIASQGTTGVAGMFHEVLRQEYGIEFNRVIYSSASESYAALLGGHVDVANLSLGDVGDNPEVIGVCVGLAERSSLAPDVPTCTELGYPIIATQTRAFLIKKGTDQAIVDYLSALFGEIAQDPDYIKENIEVYKCPANYRPSSEGEALIKELCDGYRASIAKK